LSIDLVSFRTFSDCTDDTTLLDCTRSDITLSVLLDPSSVKEESFVGFGLARFAVSIDSSDLVSFRTISDCIDTRLSGFVDTSSGREEFSVGFRLDCIDTTLSECSEIKLSVLLDSSPGREESSVGFGLARFAVSTDSSDLGSFRTLPDCTNTRLSGFVDTSSGREESSVGLRLDCIDTTLSNCVDTTLSVLIDSSSGREQSSVGFRLDRFAVRIDSRLLRLEGGDRFCVGVMYRLFRFSFNIIPRLFWDVNVADPDSTLVRVALLGNFLVLLDASLASA
jgi:hypothetical protein